MIFGINTTRDISKLLCVILQAVRRVKFSRQFWNITGGIYAKYHKQIMLLFVYTTTYKRFVIFTCRYFKLSWNTTILNRSNCRNFSCSSIKQVIIIFNKWKSRRVEQAAVVEKVDIVIHWVNHYPVKNTISFRSTYLSNSDLSGAWTVLSNFWSTGARRSLLRIVTYLLKRNF